MSNTPDERETTLANAERVVDLALAVCGDMVRTGLALRAALAAVEREILSVTPSYTEPRDQLQAWLDEAERQMREDGVGRVIASEAKPAEGSEP